MGDAIEGSHMAHPDFRANGKIFATLSADAKQGMVKLTPEQQDVFQDVHAGERRVGTSGMHDGAPGFRRREHGRRSDDARLAEYD